MLRCVSKGQEALAEVLDRVEFVVRDDDLALNGRGGDFAEIENEGHYGLFVVDGAGHARVVGGQGAVGDEPVQQSLVCADGGFGLRGIGGGIGVTPVNTMIVAARTEDVLGNRSATEQGELAGFFTGPLDFFIRLIHDELGAGAIVEAYLVLLAIDGTDLPGDVTERERHRVQIFGQAPGA